MHQAAAAGSNRIIVVKSTVPLVIRKQRLHCVCMRHSPCRIVCESGRVADSQPGDGTDNIEIHASPNTQSVVVAGPLSDLILQLMVSLVHDDL